MNRDSLRRFFSRRVGYCRITEMEALGRGAHGTGVRVLLQTDWGPRTFVLKSISPEGLGHDYPSDRAAMHLMALESFRTLPSHVRAIEVLSIDVEGEVTPIGGGVDYYLVMEEATGKSYFMDLERMGEKARLDENDRLKVAAMASYLAEIHSVKKDSRSLYLRKLRDIIGHGECLMGVFDFYPPEGPEEVLSYGEMAEIEKKCLDWRARLKGMRHRLSQIHGDFHPGNIWWKSEAPSAKKGDEGPGGFWREALCLLDRSRGPWGEPADDLTALAINYVFFSVKRYGDLRGAYREALSLFFEQYIGRTGDEEVLEVIAPFFAFRGAVVANPRFYPELAQWQRKLIFSFVHAVLDTPRFDPSQAHEYMRGHESMKEAGVAEGRQAELD